MKRVLTIEDTTRSRVEERLDEFFALEIQHLVQPNGTPEVRHYDDGIWVTEQPKSSVGLLVLHIVLTVITVGLWIPVWIILHLHRSASSGSVFVKFASEGANTNVELSGSARWVQVTEAVMRRDMSAVMNPDVSIAGRVPRPMTARRLILWCLAIIVVLSILGTLTNGGF